MVDAEASICVNFHRGQKVQNEKKSVENAKKRYL